MEEPRPRVVLLYPNPVTSITGLILKINQLYKNIVRSNSATTMKMLASKNIPKMKGFPALSTGLYGGYGG